MQKVPKAKNISKNAMSNIKNETCGFLFQEAVFIIQKKMRFSQPLNTVVYVFYLSIPSNYKNK